MKKLFIGLVALTSIASAFAGNERISTKCGKAELIISGVQSEKVYEHIRRADINTVIYEIRINGEKISQVANFELDSLVARTAIEENAELCEVVTRSGSDNAVIGRKLTIKR